MNLLVSFSCPQRMERNAMKCACGCWEPETLSKGPSEYTREPEAPNDDRPGGGVQGHCALGTMTGSMGHCYYHCRRSSYYGKCAWIVVYYEIQVQ